MPPPDDPRARVIAAYGAYHALLDGTSAARWWRFMNYGYVDVVDDEGRSTPVRSVVDLPPRMPGRNAARLVAELVGSEPLHGATVVDVGCGRGGTARLLAEVFGARRVVALDLVPAAARAAGGAAPAVHATVADAERLPLGTSTADAITNVESSLHYPDLPAFYVEVARVLRPGGAFLYTDLLWADAGDAYLDALAAAGLDLELDDDITANVLASRAQAAEREARALHAAGTDVDPDDAARFTGVTGTAFTAGLQDGSWRYRLLRLRRTSRSPVRSSPVRSSAARSTEARFAAATAAADAALGSFAATSGPGHK
ncbi:MAG: class I SAM-dependent methyltransferase [Acidimicrobiales bacterium]